MGICEDFSQLTSVDKDLWNKVNAVTSFVTHADSFHGAMKRACPVWLSIQDEFLNCLAHVRNWLEPWHFKYYGIKLSQSLKL